MKFWGVEVKAGETLKVSPGEGNVIHLSQAAIGESVMGKAESVPLYVKVGEQKLVIGTLSAHMFPQIQFDVVLDEDFELSHNSRYRSVFFCGYRAQNPEEDRIYSGDDYGSESEDEEFPIENGKSKSVEAAATKQVLSGNSKVKIDQHQPVKRPNAYSDEYSSDEDDFSDYDDENGKPKPVEAAATKQVLSGNSKVRIDQHQPFKRQNAYSDEYSSDEDDFSDYDDENDKPEPVKAAATKQVLSGNSKVKIDQHQLAKRPTAATKQVPSGNSKVKIDQHQPAKRPNAYSDEYSSDEDDFSDYDDENDKPEPVKAAATKQVLSGNSKVKIDQHQLAKRPTAATKQVPSGNSKVKIDQHQPAKRPNAYSDEYSSNEDDFSDYDDENGIPEPVKAATATKQVPSGNSKVKIDQYQPAKRPTAATKQVPSGNSKVKIDQHQPAKRLNAYSDEYSSDEDGFSDYDDECLPDGYNDDEMDGSFDEEYEKIPTPKDINKRPNEPATKTPVPPKKATFATPQKSTAGKKATATPHPAKQASKTPKIVNGKTPVSAGKATCNYCRKTFNSHTALESHSKAKHAAAAK